MSTTWNGIPRVPIGHVYASNPTVAWHKGYVAAMNSPEVQALYEAVVLLTRRVHFQGEHGVALRDCYSPSCIEAGELAAAYKAGLDEPPLTTHREGEAMTTRPKTGRWAGPTPYDAYIGLGKSGRDCEGGRHTWECENYDANCDKREGYITAMDWVSKYYACTACPYCESGTYTVTFGGDAPSDMAEISPSGDVQLRLL